MKLQGLALSLLIGVAHAQNVRTLKRVRNSQVLLQIEETPTEEKKFADRELLARLLQDVSLCMSM